MAKEASKVRLKHVNLADKSGKQSEKELRKLLSEERIKAKLDVFIAKLMGAKTVSKSKDATTTVLTKPDGTPTATLPQLDVELNAKELREICLRSREIFMLEPILLRLQPPICMLGDLHGQFLDLQKMLKKIGPPPKQKYLFLGDYVDRGHFSLETVTLLLAMKLRYPNHLYMLRGNHETRAVNTIYGFFDEVKRRFPDEKPTELWTLYQHVFNCMPLSAVISDKIFCTHGGISEDLLSFKQFDRVMRPTDITDLGLLTDLIWADPCGETKRYDISPRGISMLFGSTAIEEFCSTLGIELIVRGHQAVQDGYEFSANKRCLTIFSAPAYCGEQDNLAGILAISKQLECTIYTFKGVTSILPTIEQTTTSQEVKANGNSKEKVALNSGNTSKDTKTAELPANDPTKPKK